MKRADPPSNEVIETFSHVMRQRYGEDAFPFALAQLRAFHAEDDHIIAIWLRILEALGSPSAFNHGEVPVEPAMGRPLRRRGTRR